MHPRLARASPLDPRPFTRSFDVASNGMSVIHQNPGKSNNENLQTMPNSQIFKVVRWNSASVVLHLIYRVKVTSIDRLFASSDLETLIRNVDDNFDSGRSRFNTLQHKFHCEINTGGSAQNTPFKTSSSTNTDKLGRFRVARSCSDTNRSMAQIGFIQRLKKWRKLGSQSRFSSS
jgi:hypothetical protein